MTVNIFDAYFFEPARLHDAGDASCIVAIALIDLHFEHRPRVRRVDTDPRQAQSLELGPQPRRRRGPSPGRPEPLSELLTSECGDGLWVKVDHALLHH